MKGFLCLLASFVNRLSNLLPFSRSELEFGCEPLVRLIVIAVSAVVGVAIVMVGIASCAFARGGGWVIVVIVVEWRSGVIVCGCRWWFTCLLCCVRFVRCRRT